MTDKIMVERATMQSALDALTGTDLGLHYAAIDALRAALAAQPADPVAWIPVSDRLPTERQEYVNDLLVRNKYGNVDICSYDGYAKYFETGSSNRLGGWPVIEWLPLAAQPAEPDEIEQLRADLISCRGTVKTELNHYERLAGVHGKTPHGAAYEAEAQRLDALLDRIDAMMKDKP